MKQQVTTGIVLSRTNYGEADRILTVLSNSQGKIKLLAKGVRKIKSRLAGGIELFSVNDLTYIEGRSELHTLISSRLQKNYGDIVKDVNRTMYAYEVLKLMHKMTEESPEPEYFDILQLTLATINDAAIDLDYIRLWLALRLLELSGHSPNFITDETGAPLKIEEQYNFSFDDMCFTVGRNGGFDSRHIKILRLAQGMAPAKLVQITDINQHIAPLVQLTRTMLKQYARS